MVIDVNPKVSVCMIAYNHEAFIEQAINSVLEQKTNFPIELVIGEDASPDQTASIIRKFSNTTNVTIKVSYSSNNVGMMANFVQTLSNCSGQYIALLEGDDYWTDPNKLQQQVDFLDENIDFSTCYHPVNVLKNGMISSDSLTLTAPDVAKIEDLAKGNFMHTCSVVFRANLFNEFPASYLTSTVGDYFLHMLNAQYGPIKRLSTCMGVYRVHEGGVWSSEKNMDIKILDYLEAMIGCFDTEIDDLLKQRHQSIAFKSFYNRIDESGNEVRLLRCLKYGADKASFEISELVRWDKISNKSRVMRFLKKLIY